MKRCWAMVPILAMLAAILYCSVTPFARTVGQETISMAQIRQLIENRKQKYIGKPAQAVGTMTIDGKVWRLEDQKGKIVVLDFWATWCKGCVQAMPELERVYKKYEDNEEVLLVGVALDTSKSNVMEYCERNKIQWVQLFEPGKGFKNSCAMAFGVMGIPEICIVDKRGIVAGVYVHPLQVDDIIRKLLGS